MWAACSLFGDGNSGTFLEIHVLWHTFVFLHDDAAIIS